MKLFYTYIQNIVNKCDNYGPKNDFELFLEQATKRLSTEMLIRTRHFTKYTSRL